MRSLLLQMLAVTSINLRSLPQRRWLSLSTVVAIALVVIVLLAFLAMANGFQRTIAGSGADDIAIVMRAGSQAEINSTVMRDQSRLIEDGRNHRVLDRSIDTGCPVRILQGAKDPDVPWQHAFELTHRLPSEDVVLTMIQDGDHRLSRPQDIARLLATVTELS